LVYTSEDFKKWSDPVDERDGFALHQEDVYGESQFGAAKWKEIFPLPALTPGAN